MQSQTADFFPDATTSRIGRNTRLVFDTGPFAPLGLRENTTSSTKPKPHEH